MCLGRRKALVVAVVHFLYFFFLFIAVSHVYGGAFRNISYLGDLMKGHFISKALEGI